MFSEQQLVLLMFVLLNFSDQHSLLTFDFLNIRYRLYCKWNHVFQPALLYNVQYAVFIVSRKRNNLDNYVELVR